MYWWIYHQLRYEEMNKRMNKRAHQAATAAATKTITKTLKNKNKKKTIDSYTYVDVICVRFVDVCIRLYLQCCQNQICVAGLTHTTIAFEASAIRKHAHNRIHSDSV